VSSPEFIEIRGAREHNLADIDVRIPRNRLVVITGLSGSGKSTLAFDTLYAEGQRRYVESLSAYARQFLDQMRKPDVDAIDGLSPAIAIEQRTGGRSPRSTVGTVTEIYDHLRLLYARAGEPFCPDCAEPIASQTIQTMAERVLSLGAGAKVQVLAPVVRDRKGDHRQRLAGYRRQGFVRARIDGESRDLDEDIALTRRERHSIEVVVDRLVVKEAVRSRIAESLETAAKLGDGLVLVSVESGEGAERDLLFSQRNACPGCGFSFPEIAPRSFSFNSPHGACPECDGLGCEDCSGSRLRREARSVRFAGATIDALASRPIEALVRWLDAVELDPVRTEIAERVLREIRERLRFLENVGLGYLTLDRPSDSLSGGESQRIRLATQVGASLLGVLYVLDEPSIGLHPRDNQRLLASLERLRDQGNSVVVVEHDEETIRRADHVIDMGPAAGAHGGHVVASGTASEISSCAGSLTGDYLAGRRRVPLPGQRRTPGEHSLVLTGCRANNLKDVTLRLPLGLFTVVTGVSGSGKSTLINDTLHRALSARLHRGEAVPGAFGALRGLGQIDKVVAVDQTPIGRTPRSNAATYTGAFDPIRRLFSQVPDSRVRGYGPGRFSFNVKGGRCEACRGDGVLRIEMHFLPDLFVSCEVCGGRRYTRETLEITYKGRTIADILAMSVEEGLDFFENVGNVARPLQTLCDVGLDYLHLGQPATTLSGGEAQRIKLSRELARRDTGRTLYLLDEPTTGLHFADVERLLGVLAQLVELGNTVLVIEHHPDVIKTADHVIDLGPEGGEAGGEIIVEGTPETVAAHPTSHTGRALQSVLSSRSPA
jgi:excinuclease ABC subunit A